MTISITSVIPSSAAYGETLVISGTDFAEDTVYIISPEHYIDINYVTYLNSTTCSFTAEASNRPIDGVIKFKLTNSLKPVEILGYSFRQSISGNASGSILYTATYGIEGKILKSTDYGKTWEELTTINQVSGVYSRPTRRQGAVVTNDTGSYLAAFSSSSYEGYSIYSTDYGITWNTSAINRILFTNTNNKVFGEAFIESGTIIDGTMVDFTGWYFVRSDDYGETITKILSSYGSEQYGSYFPSADCSIIYVIKDGIDQKNIYKSTDYGDSWTIVNEAGTRQFNGVGCISDDGSVIFINYEENNIMKLLKSIDYGDTWSTCFTYDNWNINVSCDSTGKYVFLCVHGHLLYISDDYGDTFFLKSLEASGYCDREPYINSDASFIIMYGDIMNETSNSISYAYDYFDYANGQFILIPYWNHYYVSKNTQYQVRSSWQVLEHSNNYGNTWTSVDLTQIFETTDVAPKSYISNSGQYILIFNTVIQTCAISINYGDTWNVIDLSTIDDTVINSIHGIGTISNDGTIGYNSADGFVIKSTDMGNTWNIECTSSLFNILEMDMSENNTVVGVISENRR